MLYKSVQELKIVITQKSLLEDNFRLALRSLQGFQTATILDLLKALVSLSLDITALKPVKSSCSTLALLCLRNSGKILSYNLLLFQLAEAGQKYVSLMLEKCFFKHIKFLNSTNKRHSTIIFVYNSNYIVLLVIFRINKPN